MNEVTPELVAAIASKLYNEQPQIAEHPFRKFDQVGHTATGPALNHARTDSDLSAYLPTGRHSAASNAFESRDVSRSSTLATEDIGQMLLRAGQQVARQEQICSHPSMLDLKQRSFGAMSKPELANDLPTPNVSGLSVTPDVVYPTSIAAVPASPEALAHARPHGDLNSFVSIVKHGHKPTNRSLRFSELESKGSGQFGHEKAFSNIAAKSTAKNAYDVHSIRKDFPILHQRVNGHPLIWFDNAATTQKPHAVIDAVSQFYKHDNSNIHRAAHTLAARSTDAFEGARGKVQRFIGAGDPSEIVWVRGTTEGINFVAQTFGKKFLQPGDEILLSTLEHHANIVPWQFIAREMGAKIRVIPVNDAGEIMLADYQSLLGPRTKLVALTQASNSLGTILPVAEMTRMAHRFGARVLIDGAQSIAHFPVDVAEIDCDFFVFSGHKVFAPTGIGVVYIKGDLLDVLPPWQGGGNMIRNVTFEETTFADPPARFEAGTPNVADAVGLGVALDYVNRIGMPSIEHYEHELLAYATDKLSKIDGLRMIGSPRHKVSVISFVLHNRSTEEVGKALDQRGIAVRSGHHCAQPSLRRFGLDATVRPSFSIYNTFEEIDRLEEAIKWIIRH